MRLLLLWGTRHTVLFPLLVAALSVTMSLVVTRGNVLWGKLPVLPAPTINEGFDAAAFAGVPWTIQVPLVALVYPIVVSFIALMLQRRAHSSIALRVYVMDSAVVPAGASSIGLLLAMSVQYFASLYASQEFLKSHMVDALAINCIWLVFNILLTGFFLGRTVRFVQDSEARQSFTRLAVYTVLRSELPAVVMKHLVVNAPYEKWRHAYPNDQVDKAPQVSFLSIWGDGSTEVKLDLHDKKVLRDIHLNLLKVVAWLWVRRARRELTEKSQREPVITFPLEVGSAKSGEVKLCVVHDGPTLTLLEKFLVRSAFVFKFARADTLSMTAEEMLLEVAGEVESLSDQNRHGAAVDTLRVLLELHKTLLLACVAEEEGVAQNAATMHSSPYSINGSPIDLKWLTPYREVSRVAVDQLERDVRLFRIMAHVPSSLVRVLPVRPERLIIDAFHISGNLSFHLENWWIRAAQACLVPNAQKFEGILPLPNGQVYERAIVDFIGSWGNVHVSIPSRSECADNEIWLALTGRAKILASHIDWSVTLFLRAMSRGDEIAATWLYENFLKWWGNRAHELQTDHLDLDSRFDSVALSLADKSWVEAQRYLWNGDNAVTIRLAEKALNLAIRRYWESMRLFVVLLLIQNGGDNADGESRELRFAAYLIQAQNLRSGGKVEAFPLDNPDAVSQAILNACFGDRAVRARIDGFSEGLTWEKQSPEVAFWIYGWSGVATDVTAMTSAQAKLMAAVVTQGRSNNRGSEKLIESWWRDLETLDSVARHCRDIRKLVLSSEFTDCAPAVSTLRNAIGRTGSLRQARVQVARANKIGSLKATRERTLTLRSLTVSEILVRRAVERIAKQVFELKDGASSPIQGVNFVPKLVVPRREYYVSHKKQIFAQGSNAEPEDSFVEAVGQQIFENMIVSAFHQYVVDSELRPVDSENLQSIDQPAVQDLHAFVLTIASLCDALRCASKHPVILVGPGNLSGYLQPFWWGSGHWQTPLPHGVVIRGPDGTKAENAPAYVNDVPVYELPTPNGGCYIVPLEDVQLLRIGGSGVANALNYSWSLMGDEKICITVSFCFAIGSANGSSS
ncbi:hypothetical protein BLA23254_06387 [Burkholderia lata]|uniref:Uncharacterized protein n=1 Tax=Burkholderia lata (strain ATCC 17760 / DSM 23089 / LMG 22485 / NCIMB 9086 / R18194 / 383) TaxID=482957 RepID=A0A6P2RNH6_BURL3|nr:hypothetical protein [Burkholderia lata]VWC31685.1 hypothetical protein BLA23254_06387 [Burkholderia lata]